MTEVTVKRVNACQDDDRPPYSTAIVRPLRHVRAVRERYMLRFADPSQAAVSRSVRAWGWALGETATAPVTDQQTATPPSRSQIVAEIAAADGRRLRDDRENRADAAATILRWLVGGDDHVPVGGDHPGELVGGFGDIVRSREQIAGVLALATEGQEQATAQSLDVILDADDRQSAEEDAAYLDGVTATLTWVLGGQPQAPITLAHNRELTARDLKTERVHAEDVIEQARAPWMADRCPSPCYGSGVKSTITWLLGDSITSPAVLKDTRPCGCRRPPA